jgi:hypothetical protein
VAEGITSRVLDRVALVGLAVVSLLVLLVALTRSTEAGRLLGGTVVGLVGYALGRGSLRVRPPWTVLGWAGVGAAAAATAVSWLAIWGGFGRASEEALARWIGGLGAFAMLVADIGALGSFTLRRPLDRWVRGVALLGMGLGVSLVEIACITGDGEVLELLGRQVPWAYWVVGVTAAVASHAAVPILGRMERQREVLRLATLPDRAVATLQCPRCQRWLRMHAGSVACPQCRLAITLQFEEPRCGCGYPLHRLAGDACPECGRPIPPQQRWATADGTPMPPVTPPAI